MIGKTGLHSDYPDQIIPFSPRFCKTVRWKNGRRACECVLIDLSTSLQEPFFVTNSIARFVLAIVCSLLMWSRLYWLCGFDCFSTDDENVRVGRLPEDPFQRWEARKETGSAQTFFQGCDQVPAGHAEERWVNCRTICGLFQVPHLTVSFQFNRIYWWVRGHRWPPLWQDRCGADWPIKQVRSHLPSLRRWREGTEFFVILACHNTTVCNSVRPSIQSDTLFWPNVYFYVGSCRTLSNGCRTSSPPVVSVTSCSPRPMELWITMRPAESTPEARFWVSSIKRFARFNLSKLRCVVDVQR